MRVDVDLEMKGIEKAIKNIKGYEFRKVKSIRKSVAETAIKIETQATAAAPVDTGNLKNSINTQYYQNGLTAEIGTPVEYGPYVEFGTRHMKAQPYLLPAYDRNVKSFKDEIKKIINEG